MFRFNFSELLQCLDMCENDPVAIAQCFVDKVSKTITGTLHSSKINLSKLLTHDA